MAGATIQDYAVYLVKSDGTIGAENKATASNWPTTEGTATYGGSTDLWSDAWTGADINSANFGMAISAQAVGGVIGAPTAHVDYVSITVHYTAAAVSASQSRLLLMGAG